MSESDFSRLVGETRSVVLSAVRRYLPAHYHDYIDDVVQETYLRAYGALAAGKFRNDASVSTWLFAIARNEALRLTAKMNREEKKATRAGHAVKPQNTPADELDLIHEYIGGLSPDKRDVLLRQLAGRDIQDIAGELNLPAGTVKSRLSRAKADLRLAIKEVEL
jgi:RNA polymerase sigma-70 factor (ECF subfamily)